MKMLTATVMSGPAPNMDRRRCQLSEQAPGPRGSPQRPHDPAAARGAGADFAPTANADICFSRSTPAHEGHAAGREALTIASKCASQSRQMYSKIGMMRFYSTSAPTGPLLMAFWIDATRHDRLLRHIVDQQRLLIFATKPPITALQDPARLAEIPGLAAEFDHGLDIVQELLAQLAR